jgi:hypothetical protein
MIGVRRIFERFLSRFAIDVHVSSYRLELGKLSLTPLNWPKYITLPLHTGLSMGTV